MGLGLLEGHSSTQIAGFVRRSSELLSIIMACITYKMTADKEDDARKARIEALSNLFVDAMMCIGGAIMLVLAFVSENEDKGNVIPGLAIGVLGVVTNTIFWRKYTKLHRQQPDPILAVQARLCGAMSLVDGCVRPSFRGPGSPDGLLLLAGPDRLGSGGGLPELLRRHDYLANAAEGSMRRAELRPIRSPLPQKSTAQTSSDLAPLGRLPQSGRLGLLFFQKPKIRA